MVPDISDDYGLEPEIISSTYNTMGKEEKSVRSFLTIAYQYSVGVVRPRSEFVAADLLLNIGRKIVDSADVYRDPPALISNDFVLPSTLIQSEAEFEQTKYLAETHKAQDEINLAVVYELGDMGQEKDLVKAHEIFERHPDDLRSILYRAKDYLTGIGYPKNVTKAKELWATILAQDPDEPNALLGLGLIELEAGHVQAAAEFFREAGDGGHVAAKLIMMDLVRRGVIAGKQKDYLKQLIRLAANGPLVTHLLIGEELIRGSEFNTDQGLEWLWRVVELGPWRRVTEFAERAFLAGDKELALHLWLELGDMGSHYSAFNAGFLLWHWRNKPGPFGWDRSHILYVATKMFKRSFAFLREQRNQVAFICRCLIERELEESAFAWFGRDGKRGLLPLVRARMVLDRDLDSYIAKTLMGVLDDLEAHFRYNGIGFSWTFTVLRLGYEYFVATRNALKGNLSERCYEDWKLFTRRILRWLYSETVIIVVVFLVLVNLVRSRIASLYVDSVESVDE
jgi:TPR repeat protein